MAKSFRIILHHYPMSPFAEKIRLIFGFKGLHWSSVHIPNIMPKPDLTALTGGYRKTPVMQIGADIYCDTALIADVLDSLSPTPTLYPGGIAGASRTLAQWADSTLFWTAISFTMQPAGLTATFSVRICRACVLPMRSPHLPCICSGSRRFWGTKHSSLDPRQALRISRFITVCGSWSAAVRSPRFSNPTPRFRHGGHACPRSVMAPTRNSIAEPRLPLPAALPSSHAPATTPGPTASPSARRWLWRRLTPGPIPSRAHCTAPPRIEFQSRGKMPVAARWSCIFRDWDLNCAG
jgi:hypothetical protein